MEDWILIDCRDPVMSEEDSPRTPIKSEAQLREELKRYQQRLPSIIQFRNPKGELLIIGIGGPLSGLQWMKPPMKKNFKMALNDHPVTDRGVDFREQGTDTGFRPRYLFPPNEVVEAVVYFFKNNQLPDWMQWKSFGP